MDRFRMQGRGSGEQDSNPLEIHTSFLIGEMPEESDKKSILSYNSDPLLRGSLHIGPENYWSYNVDVDGIPYIVGASKININLLDRFSSIDETCNVILAVASQSEHKSRRVLETFIQKIGLKPRYPKEKIFEYARFYGFSLGSLFEKIPKIIEQMRLSREQGIEPPENWSWQGWSLS